VIVIGGGIGGLATAHYLRKARPKTRILILDNHDDFGGHARRNEFDVDGRLLLGYGGSESMEGPKTRRTNVARACVASLGVDLDRFGKGLPPPPLPGAWSLLGSVLSTPGVWRRPARDRRPGALAAERRASAPAQWSASRGLHRRLPDRHGAESAPAHAVHGHARHARGKSPAEKGRLLSTTSYRDYLQSYHGLDERSLAMFDGRTLDLFASKSEAVPALLAWGCEYPGFQGVGLQMPKAGILEGDPYIYHFPDGNASLALLFVHEMIPGVAAGRSMDDIVSARFDYSRLDLPKRAVRLRLSSTVVALANNRAGVDVLYAQGKTLTRVSADHAVYAGYSAMLPYICPDLGAAQRKAVSDQVKAPLVYVNVAIRNWQAWVNRGIHYVNNPAGFYSHLKLDYPVSLGDYRCPTRSEEPMILHLIHVPWPDGPIKDLRSAWRAGRTLAYALRFGEFESHARDELTRILGPGGFDADRDIAAITVNRWGHGYAYDANLLYDDASSAERETKVSAAPLGRIHFAGTDAAWMAYAHKAIDSAHRTAAEITA
jgi:spermidine dehydrogenase